MERTKRQIIRLENLNELGELIRQLKDKQQIQYQGWLIYLGGECTNNDCCDSPTPKRMIWMEHKGRDCEMVCGYSDAELSKIRNILRW